MPGKSGTCSLISCEEFDPNECQNFGSKKETQFLNIDGKCKLVDCTQLPGNQCNKFQTQNLLYKCISKNNICYIEEKQCSELPIEFCRNEAYERVTDKQICVLNDKKDKCKVKGTPDESQQIKISLLIIFMVSLLF